MEGVARRGHRKRKRGHQESFVASTRTGPGDATAANTAAANTAAATSTDKSIKAPTRTQKTLRFLASTFRQHAELMLNQSNFMAEFPLLGFGGGSGGGVGDGAMKMQTPQNLNNENVDGSEGTETLNQNIHQNGNQTIHGQDEFEVSQNNNEEEHQQETNKSDQPTTSSTNEQEKVFSKDHEMNAAIAKMTPKEKLSNKDLCQKITEIFAEVTDTSKLTLKDFRNLVENSLSVKLDKEQRKLLKAHLIQLITKSLSTK